MATFWRPSIKTFHGLRIWHWSSRLVCAQRLKYVHLQRFEAVGLSVPQLNATTTAGVRAEMRVDRMDKYRHKKERRSPESRPIKRPSRRLPPATLMNLRFMRARVKRVRSWTDNLRARTSRDSKPATSSRLTVSLYGRLCHWHVAADLPYMRTCPAHQLTCADGVRLIWPYYSLWVRRRAGR